MRDCLKNLDMVAAFTVEKDRPLYSATHEEILSGATTDIYFIKTMQILEHIGLAETPAIAEIFARKPGVFAGLPEALNLLKNKDAQVWALTEGERFEAKEVLMRISGPYGQYGALETPLLGILASSCGWATAAAKIAAAAGDSPVTVFGARHVHPAVAPVMERSAIVGGVGSSSCVLGAKLAGLEPVGTAPHALFLLIGDTVKAAKAYDECMPPSSARLILVDTFKDEAEESLRVAEAMGGKLFGIRLDTPSERGGVGEELVHEVRARLDKAGYTEVRIFVSGGLTPEKLLLLKNAGAQAFGVGSYISGAPAIDMTMDLKQVAGKDIAKRGRIPGLTKNPRLIRVM
ncbi:MAG: nicotinate phosphoribosyltransferase [Clostridiales bacterium]|nr:nicotinate phosphoribosyltransferase [Clostridiales bacterium]